MVDGDKDSGLSIHDEAVGPFQSWSHSAMLGRLRALEYIVTLLLKDGPFVDTIKNPPDIVLPLKYTSGYINAARQNYRNTLWRIWKETELG